MELAGNYSINRHWYLSAEWSRNWLGFTNLDFVTDEVSGRVIYAYNPKLNSSLYAQWNNENEEVLLNFRVNWIPKIGSDFYFVINQVIDTDNGAFRLLETTVLAKLIWRFAL